MPKRFPPEFKADVVRVARRGDMSIAEVAADFGRFANERGPAPVPNSDLKGSAKK